jgi:hypothetical protein
MDTTDPGYSIKCSEFAVRFNGETAWFVQTADEELGVIECFTVNGALFTGAKSINIAGIDLDPISRAPVRKTLCGCVEIVHVSTIEQETAGG